MEAKRVETKVGRSTLSLETGKMARQADGSVIVRYGDSVVLATVVASKDPMDNPFFPLRVDYREMTYAAGKFPGGFFKREGKPTFKEVLTCRLIDRPIRPLFPDKYMHELQVTAVVLSADMENDPDIMSMVGSSAALCLADNIPFRGPIGSVRVGKVGGQLIINPTSSEADEGDLDIVVAGTEEELVMIEGSANEVSEEDLLEAIMFGQRAISDIIRLQKQLLDMVGKERPAMEPPREHPMFAKLEAEYFDRIAEANIVPGKMNRSSALRAVKKEMVEACCGESAAEPMDPKEVEGIFSILEKKAIRGRIIRENKRSDGRAPEDIRNITCEVGLLPRVHGSTLFTRGETQAMVTCTLGTVTDEQRVDGLEEEYTKKFMLDYNFPGFSVGEPKRPGPTSRREMGHGDLAERSISVVMPSEDEFPYTVRIVSDILESNGSSSMASVCGGTLCLMDAGVKIRRPVAGIAMGLIKEGDTVKILSDISGEEDFAGDMDLKVAGTEAGITGIQMDLKMTGVDEDLLSKAFEQARAGRLQILETMLAALDKPREEISRYAPKLIRMKINTEKIGMVIGPGGKQIRKLQEETQSTIEIEDDGTVTISSLNAEGADKAKETIEAMTADAEVGRTYEGTVTSVKDFGAFVQILPGKDGLVHISELSDSFVKEIEGVCKVGDKMLVKVIGIDDQGRIRLSRKAALKGD